MAAKKPMVPKMAKPKVAAPPVPKPKGRMAPAMAPSYFNQQGKPDPNGDYDKEGFMVRVPGKRTKFTKPAADPADTDAARKLGYAK